MSITLPRGGSDPRITESDSDFLLLVFRGKPGASGGVDVRVDVGAVDDWNGPLGGEAKRIGLSTFADNQPTGFPHPNFNIRVTYRLAAG
jgi:hypothetical protein